MKTKPPTHDTPADSTTAVDEFMRTLEHPLKNVIEAIRASILSTDRAIAEGIKWKAPSFRKGEYFATLNLREKQGVGIILHLGAKVGDLPPGGVAIEDPAKVLRWLGKDRAMIAFESLPDFKTKQAAFEHIVRHWIEHV